jgi:hypothetical protein
MQFSSVNLDATLAAAAAPRHSGLHLCSQRIAREKTSERRPSQRAERLRTEARELTLTARGALATKGANNLRG